MSRSAHYFTMADLEPTLPAVPLHAIGQPILFSSGQFSGETIRTELHEVQQARSGRKYAKVDRRPLDPPPAILLRLYRVRNPGTAEQSEQEVQYDDIQNVGIVCTVDLFPVPESLVVEEPHHAQSYAHAYTFSPSSSARQSLTYFPVHPFSISTTTANAPPAPMAPFTIPRRQYMLRTLRDDAPLPVDVVQRIGHHLVTESSKLTPALVGEKFVEPTLVEYHGKKALVFAFGDLAVQREGAFILRYRAFDIFASVQGTQHRPILAEVYGGTFKVYSTRDFPGLEPSTDLTKRMSQNGARVTLRDSDRKSKKKPGRVSFSPQSSDNCP